MAKSVLVINESREVNLSSFRRSSNRRGHCRGQNVDFEFRTVNAHEFEFCIEFPEPRCDSSLSATAAPNQATVSFAGSLIVYFSILGFLAGYLLTLLFLAGAFGRAGQQAYGGVAAFGDDNLSVRIRNFWRPQGGEVNLENARKLAEWIKKSLPEGTSITDLISTKELEEARKKVVADLKIP